MTEKTLDATTEELISSVVALVNEMSMPSQPPRERGQRVTHQAPSFALLPPSVDDVEAYDIPAEAGASPIAFPPAEETPPVAGHLSSAGPQPVVAALEDPTSYEVIPAQPMTEKPVFGETDRPLVASHLPTSPEKDFSAVLEDFDPSKYLSASSEVRATTAEDIPMATLQDTVKQLAENDQEKHPVEYAPLVIPDPDKPRDGKAVLEMLRELSALRDK